MNDQTKGQGSDRQAQADRDIVYAFAYCEAKIEQVSRSSGIPYSTIATKVADLLYVQVGRLPLGTVQEMPPVRRSTTIKPKRLPKVAVASRSHGGRTYRVKVKRKGKVGRGVIESKVVQVLREAGPGVDLRAIDIAKRAGIRRQSAHSTVARLLIKGSVERTGRGEYHLVAA